MEAFALAVEEGSIAAAAGRLRISGPATAKRIRQLEVLAGTPLLIRGRRGVTTTEVGARLYPLAREALTHRSRVVGALTGAPAADPVRIASMHAGAAALAASPNGVNGHVDQQVADRFSEALLRGEYGAAESIVDEALERGIEIAAVHGQLIEPAMRSIGKLWERRAISVADEHLATSISHRVAARAFWRARRTAARCRERVMLAAVQGEHHVLGLRLVADVLDLAGYDVLFLGADVPLPALLDACCVHQPEIVGLSATMPLNIPIVTRAIDELRQLPSPPRLMCGGWASERAAGALDAQVVEHCDRVVGAVEQLLAVPARSTAQPEL